MLGILTILAFAWTTGVWFSGPFGRPFLGLGIFAITPFIPLTITFLLALVTAITWFNQNQETVKKNLATSWHNQKRTFGWLLLIVFFHLVVVAGPAIIHFRGENDSDSALHGLAGYHIADGQERPMFVYGVHYVGSLKTHLTALLHLTFGKSPIYQRLLGAFFYCGFLVGFFFFVRRLWNENTALLATLLAAIPPYAVAAQLRYEEFVELPFWGIFSLLLLLAITGEKKERPLYYFWYGVVLGLLFFAHPQAIFFILTGFIVLLITDKLAWLRWRSWLIPLGFAVGTFPTWVDSYFYDWVIFKYFFGSEVTNAPKLLERLTRGLARLYNNLAAFLGFEEVYPKFFTPSSFLLALLLILLAAAFVYYIYSSRAELATLCSFKNKAPQKLIPLILAALIIVIFVGAGKSYLFGPFRYIFLLWLVIPIVIAVAATVPIAKMGRWLGKSFFVLTLTLFSLSQFTYIKTTTTKDHEWRNWLNFCVSRNITHFYGDFWLVYNTNFISQQQIIGSSCFPFNYDPYEPFRVQVENASKPAAYVFSPPLLVKADDWAARFEMSLNELQIQFRKEIFQAHIVYYDLSEALSPAQLAAIQPFSPVVYKKLTVQKITTKNEEIPALQLLTILCQNTGTEELTSNSPRRITEAELTTADGLLIRKQPLTKPVKPGEDFTVSFLLDKKEIKGHTLRLHIRLNDIIFSANKTPFTFSEAQIAAAERNSALPAIEMEAIWGGGALGTLPDFILSRGWGMRLWENNCCIQSSGANEMEILLPLTKSGHTTRITLALDPFRDELFKNQEQTVSWTWNGEVGGEVTIKKGSQIALTIPGGRVIQGLNRLVLRPRLVEPVCRSIYGDAGWVLRPQALVLRALTVIKN